MYLPTKEGKLDHYCLRGEPLTVHAPVGPFTRVAFAAAHVISDPLVERDPWGGRPAVDWDATLGYRHFLWDQRLYLAEAMDTAQRGMGVDWLTAKELIERSLREAKAHPMKPRVACGAGTDQFDLSDLRDEDAILRAYEEQMEAIEAAGGQCILMASRAMVALGGGPDSYHRVYGRLIENAERPVILHWLGSMFDPALEGYWGDQDLDRAEETVLTLMNSHPGRVDGIKISLLNQSREESFRTRLPHGVKLYTGDDFNYVALIAGRMGSYSHALLGVFAAIAPAAAQGLDALAQGNMSRFHALLEPTVPLSRELFKRPTLYYKAGIAFLSWMNGLQGHFIMPAGLQSSREITHYATLFRLADQCGLLLKPDLAVQRMKALLAIHGVN